MNGPVIIFVLLASAVNTKEVGGPVGFQTVGYYTTFGECQTDLIRLSKTADQSLVKLDCKPLRISE